MQVFLVNVLFSKYAYTTDLGVWHCVILPIRWKGSLLGACNQNKEQVSGGNAQ